MKKPVTADDLQAIEDLSVYVARLSNALYILPPVASNSLHRAAVRALVRAHTKARNKLDDLVERLSERLSKE